MANTTVRVLPYNTPANSLAVWLGVHHPDLFVQTVRAARAAKARQKLQMRPLGGLDDDLDSSSPDDVLQQVTFDPGLVELPDNLITDSGSSGSVLDVIGSGVMTAGSTVTSALESGGTDILSALGSAANYLSSSTGLNTLASLGKSYFQAQSAASSAQTQGAVLQAQIARTATNQAVAPITYTTASNGQVVPVYASTTAHGTVYQPLTAQGLASLTPSSLSVFVAQYGLYLLAGVGVTVALALRKG